MAQSMLAQMKVGATANKDEVAVQVCSINYAGVDYSYLLTNEGHIIQVNNTLYSSQQNKNQMVDNNEDPDTIFYKQKKIKQMVQGRNHVLILDLDGNVFGWGSNESHQVLYNRERPANQDQLSDEQSPLINFVFEATQVKTPAN